MTTRRGAAADGAPDLEFLRDKLIGIEGLVHHLRVKFEVDREATKAVIEKDIEDAEAALRRIEDDADAAHERMRALLAKGRESADLIADWKRNGQLGKLERRAEDAEAHAAWSLIVATRAIDEAELATLRAIAARMDFENGLTE